MSIGREASPVPGPAGEEHAGARGGLACTILNKETIRVVNGLT